MWSFGWTPLEMSKLITDRDKQLFRPLRERPPQLRARPPYLGCDVNNWREGLRSRPSAIRPADASFLDLSCFHVTFCLHAACRRPPAFIHSPADSRPPIVPKSTVDGNNGSFVTISRTSPNARRQTIDELFDIDAYHELLHRNFPPTPPLRLGRSILHPTKIFDGGIPLFLDININIPYQ